MNREQANEFKVALEKGLRKIAKEQRGGKTEWTATVKKCLLEVANEFHFSSNCHMSLPIHLKYDKHDNHEWLCDVMVYDATKEGIKEIILCAESEWSTNADEIFWDFSKLLVIKSKFHLMVYNATKENNVLEELKEYIKSSEVCQGDETYLFASYPKECDEQLQFDEYKKET